MSGVSGKVMSTDVMNESHLKTTDVEKKYATEVLYNKVVSLSYRKRQLKNIVDLAKRLV